MNKYSDIINLPHHVSSKRLPMPMINRAAQFAPFAALSGYDAAIEESGRLTDGCIDLDESSKEALNERLQLVREIQDEEPEITVAYFQPDERKAGGAYLTASGRIKKIDEYQKAIMLADGMEIPFSRIYAISGAIFSEMEDALLGMTGEQGRD